MGVGKIQVALQAMQEALPTIPMGTELHKAVLDAIKKIGTHMTEMKSSPQMQAQNMLQMLAQVRAAQPNAALAAIAGGGPGGPGGPGPGQPPAMMPPPGAPPGMQAAA